MKPFRAIVTGSNQVEIRTQRYRILCSFGIPVAYEDLEDRTYFRSSNEFSKSSERHIAAFLENAQFNHKPQEYLDSLLEEAEKESDEQEEKHA